MRISAFVFMTSSGAVRRSTAGDVQFFAAASLMALNALLPVRYWLAQFAIRLSDYRLRALWR